MSFYSRRLGGIGLGAALLASLGSQGAEAQDAPKSKLVGFAVLPADTFAAGPASGADDGTGAPVTANGRTGPFPGQPVQGFSGVQFAPGSLHQFWFLSDNGFGAKENSADFLLRIQRARPEFRIGFRALGVPVKVGSGDVELEGFIQLSDPDHKVPFPIVRESTPERWLTGADFDVESFVIARNGDLWVGDEFGPYLLHFDRKGRLLEAPIPTPDLQDGDLSDTLLVRSPQNPTLGGATPNLGRSKGFEGMAFSPDKRTLYPLLEGTVEGDPTNALRIYEFDVRTRSYEAFVGFYDAPEGRAIWDFTPINDREFLVIERDNGQGATAKFKKIYKVDLRRIDERGYVHKEELVDLMNVSDPLDLNHDESTLFTFPFQTIEDVLVLSPKLILVANDNNYPFSVGRTDADDNEVIVLELPEPMRMDPRLLFLK